MPYSRTLCPTCNKLTVYNEDGCLHHEQSRRTMKLRMLCNRLDIDIANGKETLEEVDAVLKEVSKSGYLPQTIQAIRSKN